MRKQAETGERWLSAAEACALLKVKRATLYAYVSRGHVRSMSQPGSRRRVYAQSDVERVRQRGEARSGHGPVAAVAMRWGEPVLETVISAVGVDGPRYRGRSALELARSELTFEEVARQLWQADAFEPLVTRPHLARLPKGSSAIDHLVASTLAAASTDPQRGLCLARHGHPRAARLLRILAREAGPALGLERPKARDARCVVELLGLSLGAPRSSRVRKALRVALIVCADHELNPSTFAARIAASAGADLYSSVAAALCAFSGHRHGAASTKLERLCEEIRSSDEMVAWVQRRLQEGDEVPCFGHPLYAGADPRATALLDVVAALPKKPAAVSRLLTLQQAMALAGAPGPNIDFGLVVLARALGLPRGAGSIVYAVGRSVGWAAHVFEQWESPHPLRPRARYCGPDA